MDARRAADRLGIPFYVWDFSERFRDDVIEDFVAEYSAGRTPNPCMRCNERIKFAAVLEKALDLGFDAVCTGHYAIVRDGASGERSSCTGRATTRRTSPTCSACSPPSSSRTRSSRSARRRRRRSSAPRPRPAASPSRTSPTATTSASSPTATRAAGSPTASARPSAATSSIAPAPSWARTRARTPSRWVSAADSRSACRRADGKPRFVLEVRPVSNTVVVGPKEALATAEIAGERFTWAGAAPTLCRLRVPRADPRTRRPGAGARGARGRHRHGHAGNTPRRRRARARPRCCTTARACSASSRSTARSRRFPSPPEAATAGHVSHAAPKLAG